MSQEQEPSIIEYARFYGLIRNHLEPHPLQAVAAHDDLPLLKPDDDQALLPMDLTSFKIAKERLTVDAGAASLLLSIAALAKEEPSRSEDEIDTHRIGRMKHELPLLSSDHELDILCFASHIVPDLKHEFLPLETVDEEADEGFGWPARCHELPDEHTRKLVLEKLQVSSDALGFLQETLRWHLDGGEHELFEDVELPIKKRSKVELISPPLLPLSPIAEPYIPSSDTGRLDILSDPTSPTRQEIRDVERMLFDGHAVSFTKKKPESSSQCSDQMLLESDCLGEIYSPLKGIQDPPSSPPPPRPPLQDRKVEVPLSPAHSERLPLWKRKSVSFCEALPELIPELPQPIPKPENISSSDVDLFFEEVILPIGVQAERTIEQEQLQEEDTTLRVPVPIMDFSLPAAPWKDKTTANSTRPCEGDETYRKALSDMKGLHFSQHIWPMSGKAERELTWTPFPSSLGRVGAQESINDDGTLGVYLAQPERVDVDTLTWKPDGLRLLDDLAESDEELEHGIFPVKTDFDSLMRKRKLELEEEDYLSPLSGQGVKEAKANERRSKVFRALVDHRPVSDPLTHRTANKASFESLFDSSFSAVSALEDFISVRKGVMEKPELKADQHFSNTTVAPQPGPAQAKLACDAAQSKGLIVAPQGIIPSPTIILPAITCPFVVSASFLRNRYLSRHIQRLFPSVEFIERDYNLFLDQQQWPSARSNESPQTVSTIIRSVPGQIHHIFPSTEFIQKGFQRRVDPISRPQSIPKPPPQAVMTDEADMILSPSTGLIWTTLQKIKQRSLPGQIARSAVRERIIGASPRYGRLLVMVSEGPQTGRPVDGRSQLDNSDCEALVELMAFCSTLDDEVLVMFIGGVEEDLAKWIVAIMINYGITDPELKLIQDETLWEVFLRRAGMNTFAAQAILGKLKGPEQPEVGGGDFGLRAFVRMSLEERLERFETLLGGRRLLGRVSRVLDARW